MNVQYNETVSKIIKSETEQKFTVVSDLKTYTSKTIALAIGILGKPNKPNYKIIPTIKNRITYDLTSTEIKNAHVLVVGGGDSASEYCQFLSDEKSQNKVSLSYRGNTILRMNDLNKDSLLTMAGTQKIKLMFNCNIENLSEFEGKTKVHFAEEQYADTVYDYIVYALGGTSPENFLKTVGIAFDGQYPILKEDFETSVSGLFLLGDLSAGKKGGSIIWAFNSSNTAMRKICSTYLSKI